MYSCVISYLCYIRKKNGKFFNPSFLHPPAFFLAMPMTIPTRQFIGSSTPLNTDKMSTARWYSNVIDTLLKIHFLKLFLDNILPWITYQKLSTTNIDRVHFSYLVILLMLYAYKYIIQVFSTEKFFTQTGIILYMTDTGV